MGTDLLRLQLATDAWISFSFENEGGLHPDKGCSLLKDEHEVLNEIKSLLLSNSKQLMGTRLESNSCFCLWESYSIAEQFCSDMRWNKKSNLLPYLHFTTPTISLKRQFIDRIWGYELTKRRWGYNL